MNTIIYFFTNVLVGPTYIALVIVNIILIFAIIGYLAERKIKNDEVQNKITVIDTPMENTDSLIKEEIPIVVEEGKPVMAKVANPIPELNVNITPEIPMIDTQSEII